MAYQRRSENLKNYGAVLDGIADDTIPFQNAATVAAANGRPLYIPAGICLLTDGFTTQSIFESVIWIGGGSLSEGSGAAKSSRIKFAPSATTKYLYNQTLRQYSHFSNLVIEGVDPVDGGELKLFRYTTGGAKHHFKDIDFEGNHHWSTYYEDGCNAQSSSYRDVQWRGCGTIGSASTALKGTLLTLDNVNHESTTPANTRKVVMDLRGFRVIEGTNVLLEGALPEADTWTALDIDQSAVVAGITNRENGAYFNGFWLEYTSDLLHSVKVNGSICHFRNTKSLYTDNYDLRLDNGALVTIEGSVVVGQNVKVNLAATFDDVYSELVFQGCTLREVSNITNPNKQITYKDCHNVRDNLSQELFHLVDTIDSEVLYEWDGGLLSPNSIITHPAVSSTSHLRTIITDATYGRLINIEKNVGDVPRFEVIITAPTEWDQMPLSVVMYAKFPTATGGSFYQMRVSGTESAALEGSLIQNAFAWYNFQIRLPAGGGAVSFNTITNHDTSSDPIQIAALRVTLGKSFGRFPSLKKPINTISFDSATPTTGTFIVGDRVYNTAPSAAGTIGFICTTGGSPGTWKTFGTIEA